MSDELEMVRHKIEYEGFDYALTSYSSWGEVKDKEFHKLRKAYVKAKEALEAYIFKDAE